MIGISNERKIECWEFDVELDKEEMGELSSLGLDLIKDDEDALINYVFNRLLKRMIERETKKE